jgi:DNA-binding transcriptional LysR family regulator
MYPDQNYANQQYISNQLSAFSQSLTDVGRKFLETSREIYEKINDAVAVRAAKAALRMSKGLFHPNAIVPLETLDELRSAQPVMQRYIMAEPMLRSLYHQQRIDGYSDTYQDIQPGIIGEDHYDYRRVMTGNIQEEVRNGEEVWVARQYLDEIHPDDRELDIQERHLVISAWDLAKKFLQTKQDPTNIFGGDVG